MKKPTIEQTTHPLHLYFAKNLRKYPVHAINSLFERYGLVEATTARQKKNGTIMYQDTLLKDTYYTFHTNGYYRRKFMSYGKFYGTANITYQLNPLEHGSFDTPYGYTTDTRRRVEMFKGNQNLQMNWALYCALHYRINSWVDKA